jgi:hypothetical protein
MTDEYQDYENEISEFYKKKMKLRNLNELKIKCLRYGWGYWQTYNEKKVVNVVGCVSNTTRTYADAVKKNI